MVTIHSSAIVDEGADIGAGSRVWHFCHICAGAVIGENVSLGQNVFVGRGAFPIVAKKPVRTSEAKQVVVVAAAV